MRYAQSLIIGLIASQVIAAAAKGGEDITARFLLSKPSGANSAKYMSRGTPAVPLSPLDYIATAVDGAESSHGTDAAMWRPKFSGPQGPMQISEAAATDVGGGDRFDLVENRALGRAYLAQLYARFRNWPDAIVAYNWGLGNLEAWVRAGRPPDKFLPSVAIYVRRVLRESGLCETSRPPALSEVSGKPGPTGHPVPMEKRSEAREVKADAVVLAPDASISVACSAPDHWVGLGTEAAGGGLSRFSKRLNDALQLAMQRARQSP